MKDTTTKIPGKAAWVHVSEWTTETLRLQKNGAWRLETEGEGWGGRGYLSIDCVDELSAQDAVGYLRTWGISEEEIARVAPSLADLMTADMADEEVFCALCGGALKAEEEHPRCVQVIQASADLLIEQTYATRGQGDDPS